MFGLVVRFDIRDEESSMPRKNTLLAGQPRVEFLEFGPAKGSPGSAA